MEIIKAIREASRKGGNENILSIAALSYSKGLQDGAEIERSQKTAWVNSGGLEERIFMKSQYLLWMPYQPIKFLKIAERRKIKMDAIKASEIKVISKVSEVNELLKKNWSVLEIFLREGRIVYVVGKNVRNCTKTMYVSKTRENVRYSS